MARFGSGALGVVVQTAAAVAVLSSPAAAQPEHARAKLVSEHDSLVAGQTGWLGLSFEVDPGWHLYWNGLNDTGYPIQFEVKAPEGFKVGPAVWPAPVRHIAPGDLLDHVYEKRVTLLIPVEVPAQAAGTKAAFAVESNWLVCKEACLMGSANLHLEVPVARAGEKATRVASAALFDEARALVPRRIAPGDEALRLEWKDGVLVIRSGTEKELAFYPGVQSVAVAGLVESGVTKGGELKLKPEKPAADARIAGVVEVGQPRREGRTLYWVDSPIPSPNRGVGPKEGGSGS